MSNQLLTTADWLSKMKCENLPFDFTMCRLSVTLIRTCQGKRWGRKPDRVESRENEFYF